MLSKRAKNISPSMTLGINAKVKELKERGEDILSFNIGEPDFHTPERAKEGAFEAIRNNKTKYDNASGNLSLRKAIAKYYREEYGVEVSEDEIVVSSGAKHAITNALVALCDPGDEVLIPHPYWVSYPESVKLSMGVPVIVETKRDNGFKVTIDELKNHLNDKTKVLILCNPSNPTGNIYTKEELEAIGELCIEKDIYIISDEIYEKLVYDEPFTSLISLSPLLRKRVIIINGLSKTASMTGWRIGYSISNKTLAKAIGSIQSHMVSHPSTVSQEAALYALTDCQKDVENMVLTYRERRNLITEFLDSLEDVSYVPPLGAFYVFINVEKLRKVYPEGSLSLQVCEALLDEKKISLVPGIGFGEDNYVRFSYATDKASIREGLKRFQEFLQEKLHENS